MNALLSLSVSEWLTPPLFLASRKKRVVSPRFQSSCCYRRRRLRAFGVALSGQSIEQPGVRGVADLFLNHSSLRWSLLPMRNDGSDFTIIHWIVVQFLPPIFHCPTSFRGFSTCFLSLFKIFSLAGGRSDRSHLADDQNQSTNKVIVHGVVAKHPRPVERWCIERLNKQTLTNKRFLLGKSYVSHSIYGRVAMEKSLPSTWIRT